VLDADGRLRFGGGSDARIRSATVDAGVLSQEQRMEVWRIVLENGLLESEGRLIVDHKGTRYEFNAHSGNVRLALGESAGFELNASTFSGTIRSNLSVALGITSGNRRRTGRSAHVVVGNGGAAVDISTFSGNIVIERR